MITGISSSFVKAELPPVNITSVKSAASGAKQISWEGPSGSLYTIEWSTDLVTWKLATTGIPVLDGQGSWGDVGSMSRFHPTSEINRFYRLIEQGSVTPGDPSGGDGISTFGGNLAVLETFENTQFTVTANLPSGEVPSTVEVYVDGVMRGYAEEESGGSYVYQCPSYELANGTLSAYAVINSLRSSTPEGDEPTNTGNILRTPSESFNKQGLNPVSSFQITECQIDPNDPDVPDTTFISASIDLGQVAWWSLDIKDKGGNVVRQEYKDIPSDSETLEYSWDGTDSNGTMVAEGLYSILIVVGYTGENPGDEGGIIEVEPCAVRVGQKHFRALIISESMKGNWSAAQQENYSPEWAAFAKTSGNGWNPGTQQHGNQSVVSAWGKWGFLTSLSACNEIFLKDLGRRSSDWKVKAWDSGNIYHQAQGEGLNIPQDFETGNPFNNYDLGIQMGHGVSTGWTFYYKQGSTFPSVLPPQHYFPIIKDQATKETFWLKSGEMAEKYGQTGKLKWMFLVTCNPLCVGSHSGGSTHPAPYGIYDHMKTADSLPMGEKLHVMCGYTTKILIGTDLAKALMDGLQQRPNQIQTVVQAWGHAWDQSANKTAKNARSVYWPECKQDTIDGVSTVDITDPAPGQPQTSLQHTDTKYP